MAFIDDIKNKAKKDIKTIILTESEDIRVLEAAAKVKQEGFANVILIGNEEDAKKRAKANNIDISGIPVINPETSERYEEYVNAFYELRKAKGMTEEKAREMLKDNMYFEQIH